MNSWTEKTWIGPMIVRRALSLLQSYQEHPNRPLQSAVMGAGEYYASDALVQQQMHKVLHAMSSNK
jgi:hypothetical protein